MLEQIWLKPRSVCSDFARSHAAEFAALASQGMITTRMTSNVFGRLWRITAKGLCEIS